MEQRVKGIIFDMDNTLLRSTIDFAAMKKETFQFLMDHGLISAQTAFDPHTTSTLIEEAMRSGRMTEDLLEKIWGRRRMDLCTY